MKHRVAPYAWGRALSWVLALSGIAFAIPATSAADSEPAEEIRGIASPQDDVDATFDDDDLDGDVSDPIEDTNRAVLQFNGSVDRFLWSPLSAALRFILPGPAQTGVSNALWHIETPSVLVNDLAQGRPVDAARTLGRFLVNTTVGLGGLLDPAAAIGLERHEADMGQTLGRWGVGPGPYLIVPFVGPATVRDGFGGVADAMMNPLTYVIGPGGSIVLGVVFLNFGKSIAIQERYRGDLEALKQGSVDYYAALRSLYFQSRTGAVREAVEASSRTCAP